MRQSTKKLIAMAIVGIMVISSLLSIVTASLYY